MNITTTYLQAVNYLESCNSHIWYNSLNSYIIIFISTITSPCQSRMIPTEKFLGRNFHDSQIFMHQKNTVIPSVLNVPSIPCWEHTRANQLNFQLQAGLSSVIPEICIICHCPVVWTNLTTLSIKLLVSYPQLNVTPVFFQCMYCWSSSQDK